MLFFFFPAFSLLSIRDEIVFSTSDGYLQRLPWKGKSMDLAHKISIYDISLSADLQHSRGEKVSSAKYVNCEFSVKSLSMASTIWSTNLAWFWWLKNYFSLPCIDQRLDCVRPPITLSNLNQEQVWGFESAEVWFAFLHTVVKVKTKQKIRKFEIVILVILFKSSLLFSSNQSLQE